MHLMLHSHTCDTSQSYVCHAASLQCIIHIRDMCEYNASHAWFTYATTCNTHAVFIRVIDLSHTCDMPHLCTASFTYATCVNTMHHLHMQHLHILVQCIMHIWTDSFTYALHHSHTPQHATSHENMSHVTRVAMLMTWCMLSRMWMMHCTQSYVW